MEHVRRLHENATKILKIYTDEANPREASAILKVMSKDVNYLVVHHSDDQPARPVPAREVSHRLPGAWENERQPEAALPSALPPPPSISCENEVKKHFRLSENTYRAAFVLTSHFLRG